MSDIKPYPEVNAKIVELLRLADDMPSQYAAARIEELEAEVARLREIEKDAAAAAENYYFMDGGT